MAVNKKLKAFYIRFWQAPENLASKIIMFVQNTAILRKKLDPSFKLTREQKKEVREFWKPYARVSVNWARYNAQETGVFDPRYIPYTVYYNKIDPYFNSKRLGDGFNDKNYYSQIFSDVKQPQTVVRNIGGLLFDADYRLISAQEALKKAEEFDEVIFKPSQETGSGRGIIFLRAQEEGDRLLKILQDKSESNYIVQAVLKQHEALSKLNPTSLNTMRILTLMLEDGVHILSCVLRMGIDGSRLDNASAGGIYVSLKPDGSLGERARSDNSGDFYFQHPNGAVFKGYKIPNFEKVLETVVRSAQKTGNFRLVSWDMSMDESGEPVLIEANMRKGGVSVHQFTNGPMFGDLTQKVLSEVYLSKKAK